MPLFKMREPPSLDSTATDADLVEACLAGERDAFARIVERYQRLLCSLAYAATGNMRESEEAAHETFIAAWSHLGDLREPAKLRPWLCGILRHKIGRQRREFSREAVLGAEPLEAADEIAATDLPAAEKAMNEEEQRILWRALGQLPALYREPLVLYYRENRSIEHVAAALDLSENAVKQRLARGRKMLQEQALAFVEGALERTTPGRAFTLGVLIALPALAPAKSAGVAATVAAHGGALAKMVGLATVLASITGAVNAVMQLRANLDQSRTPRERRFVVKVTIACFFGTFALIGVLWGLREAAYRWWEQRAVFAGICQVLVVGFMAAWPVFIGRIMAYSRRLRSEERRLHPELFHTVRDRVGSRAGTYRSRASLFGVPLVHIRFATPDEGEGPVVGWIAAGDRAFGVLFAWGGWAVAPVSIGGFSVGLLSVGAVTVGAVGLGTFAAGLVSVGAISVGVKAYAWLSALGWQTATSAGFGIAHWAALAPVALARHANDATAYALLADPHPQQSQMGILIAVVLFSLVPMALYAREVRRRFGRPKS